MKLYKTQKHNLLESEGQYFIIDAAWDELINRDSLYDYLNSGLSTFLSLKDAEAQVLIASEVMPPIGSQEVWAAGVTYMRSKEARMDESKESGGADLYDSVYHADRPELFFKALPHNVRGPGQSVNIRKDSTWNVPEPELTLFISSSGIIQAYTIGNDMSSRSIEGENALYLPQAKVYDKSAALGPCLYVTKDAISPDTTIHMSIYRDGVKHYADSVQLSKMKRTLEELTGFLFRESNFNHGCFLMTGTCLVPPNDFTLEVGDLVRIQIDGIGTLNNVIAVK